MRQSVGDPDPFRPRYRNELRDLVGQLVRNRTRRSEATARIAAWMTAHIAPADRDRFIETAEAELTGLHDGNFARYRIRPSELEV